MRGHHKTDKLDSDWHQGTAYIVETRRHNNLLAVIENADQCLPKDWLIIIFCSSQNYIFVDEVKRQVIGRRVLVKKLDNLITSLKDYNDVLFSADFWQQFETENLLGFQVDSWFSLEQKSELKEIAKYDYVGAPWSESIQRRWNYIPSYGGNGGVCFSKRSARLKALVSSDESRVTAEPHNQILNEDIWFSHAIKSVGGQLPTRALSTQWFVESVYSPAPFAMHKPWRYLSVNQFSILCENNKGLKALKDGCDKPIAETDKTSYRKFLLRFARACLDKDNYYQADLALQVCQQRFPAHPTAFNLQALLAHRLRLYTQALSFVEKALSHQPDFTKALDNKVIIEGALFEAQKKPKRKSNDRFLLIHSWGSGLGFDLLYLLKQLMVAELTGRKPIIYWGNNSLYNDHPEKDCFTDYFEDVSRATLKQLDSLHKDCYPEYWRERELTDHLRRTRWRDKRNGQQYNMTGLYFLNRDEGLLVSGEFTTIKTLLPWIPKTHRLYGLSVTQIYSDLMKKYIKPKRFLQRVADDFVSKKINDGDFIGIHLRGTDKKQEKQSNDIESINNGLIEQVDKLDSSLLIFVMTDDIRQIKIMRERFGDRVKSIDVTRSDGDELGVHHTAQDKAKIAHEVIVDMLIAAQAKYFFGCGFSYLACCVEAMRGDSKITVLRPFDLMTRFTDVPTVGKFGIE